MRLIEIKRPRAVLMIVMIAAAGILAAGLPFLLLARVSPASYAVAKVEGERIAVFPEGVIRYQDSGEGAATLLFLHGFNAELGQWDQVWDRLAGCDARRLRIDVPGFGASAWDVDDYGLPKQAERVIALLDSLGVQKVTLIGTSMGASLSAWIAAMYPHRVAQVGLMAPSGYPGSLSYPGLFGMIVRPGSLNKGATWIARTRIYSRLFPRSRALQAVSVTATYGEQWATALTRIKAPTLLAWSRVDTTARETAAPSVQRAIVGSTLVWLDGATGHSIPNSRPDFAAEVACQLALGTPPAEIARNMPAPLLRAGEGVEG
jgi:pimeloyl-ACP methyl ester carboxylesterase